MMNQLDQLLAIAFLVGGFAACLLIGGMVELAIRTIYERRLK